MVFKFTFKIQLISPNGSHLFGKDHMVANTDFCDVFKCGRKI